MITMFEGFTEAEIKKVAFEVSTDADHQPINKLNNKYKQGNFGSVSRDIIRAKRKNEVQRKVSFKESKLPSPNVNNFKIEEEEYQDENNDIILPGKQLSTEEKPKEEPKEANLIDVSCVLTSQTVLPKPMTTIPDVDAINFEDSATHQALNEFEETRRKLEAFNSERKELLRQALSDRAKKTHEEVKKLNQIEEELKKLDSTLSNDVCILRNQIESASHDFMEAQKRFNRAEKEYVEAKMELFTKKERKELLTSHLCSIIEQNELRKAKKISDLMEKLEVPLKPLPIIIKNAEEIKDKKVETEDNNISHS